MSKTYIIISTFLCVFLWSTTGLSKKLCIDTVGTSAKHKVSKLNSRLADSSYKVLVLGRHGKASQIDKIESLEGQADIELAKREMLEKGLSEDLQLDVKRPLTKKGEKASNKLALLMGKLLFRGAGIWGSFAKRAKDTGRLTSEILGDQVKFEIYEEGLYYADVVTEMHTRLTSEKGEGVSHAFFWGHGSTTVELFKHFTGAKDAFLPTASVMIVAVKAESWEQAFRSSPEQVEAYVWSPNKTHKVKGSKARVMNLENFKVKK